MDGQPLPSMPASGQANNPTRPMSAMPGNFKDWPQSAGVDPSVGRPGSGYPNVMQLNQVNSLGQDADMFGQRSSGQGALANPNLNFAHERGQQMGQGRRMPHVSGCVWLVLFAEDVEDCSFSDQAALLGAQMMRACRC